MGKKEQQIHHYAHSPTVQRDIMQRAIARSTIAMNGIKTAPPPNSARLCSKNALRRNHRKHCSYNKITTFSSHLPTTLNSKYHPKRIK